MASELFNTIGTKPHELALLAKKTWDEIAQPKQLLDQKRRADLWKKGVRRLMSINQRLARSPEIEEELEKSLLQTYTGHGISYYLFWERAIYAAVFPPTTKIFYNPPFKEPVNVTDGTKCVGWIS